MGEVFCVEGGREGVVVVLVWEQCDQGGVGDFVVAQNNTWIGVDAEQDRDGVAW